MNRIHTTLISILICISSSAQVPALLISGEADQLATGRSGITSSEFAIGGQRLNITANYGIWAPESADNTIAGFKIHSRITDNLFMSLKGSYLGDRTPSSGYNELGAPTGNYYPKDFLIGAGMGFKLIEGFAVGIDAKMLRSSMGVEPATNVYAIDLSATYKNSAICTSANIRNLGSDIFAQLNAAYEIAELTTSAEIKYDFNKGLMAAIGADYTIMNLISLRASYHYGNSVKLLPSFICCGIGLEIFGVNLNTSYILGSETLGKSLIFSVGYSF